MKLLLIEDEIELSDSVVSFLVQDEYICEAVHNFDQAIEKLNLYQYDCVIVDIMLPDGSGFDVIKQLQAQQSDCGIIIVSAKNALDDRILGLDLGADDYLTKPFHLPELSARIKAVIRRRNFQGKNEISFEEIFIFPDERTVHVGNNEIKLTKKEFDLLIFLISNKDRVVSREAIAENIIGDHADLMDSFNFIYSHVKNLRKKIIDAGGGDYIRSVYSIGYKFGKI